MWCSKVRPSAGALHVKSDRHSPGLFRANGVVSQNPDFARLFRCPAGRSEPAAARTVCERLSRPL
jgi:predicted metalloendopeptidase